MATNGETAYTAYNGRTTSEKFVDYLKNVLAPTLRDSDIVVMDNMRTHHAKTVKKVIEELKINVIFLPPYSPDYNPIEKMWSKVKAVLRKLKARSASELTSATNEAFDLISVDDCCGWFGSYFVER
ncbi:MAG: transposase [Prevotella sp.]|nr:transposase [Prevotella sp.]